MVDTSSGRRLGYGALYRRSGPTEAMTPMATPQIARPISQTPLSAYPYAQPDTFTTGGGFGDTPAPSQSRPTIPVAINPFQAPAMNPMAIPGTYNPASNSALADGPETPNSPVKGSGNGVVDFMGRLGDATKSFFGNGSAPVYDPQGNYIGYDPSSPDGKQEGLSKLVNLFKFFSS